MPLACDMEAASGLRRPRTRRGAVHRFRRRGAALVEAAIVLLILLLILAAMVEYGWLIYIKHTVTNAARVGARYGVVASRTTTDAEKMAKEALKASLGATNASHYTVTAALVKVPPTGTPQMDCMRVTVSASWQDPQVGVRVLGVVPSPYTVQAVVTMQRE